jgi:HK97 family phage portal protein
MSLFSRWFGREETAAKTYTILDLARDVGWEEYGIQPGGITPKSSLQAICVYRCVNLLSGLLASFPLDLFRKTPAGRQAVGNHPIDRLFNVEFAPELDAFSGRQVFYSNWLLGGFGIALKAYSGNRVIRLDPVEYSKVSYKRNDAGELEYTIDSQRYSRREIFHVNLMSLDGVTGLSPIEQVRLRIAGHVGAEKHQATLYKNKPQPGMVIGYQSAISQQTIDQLQEQIGKGFTGASAGRPMILAGLNGYPQVNFPQVPLTDLQWLESLQYGEEQIARLYGIPPVVLGITTKSTSWGSGIEQQNIGFLQYTLTPLVAALECAIRQQLLSDADRRDGVYVKHNMASMLRGDLKAQAEAITTYVRGGIYSPNEGRALLDMNPYDGGDEHFMQSQMWPVEQLGTAPQSAPAPEAGGSNDAVATD